MRRLVLIVAFLALAFPVASLAQSSATATSCAGLHAQHLLCLGEQPSTGITRSRDPGPWRLAVTTKLPSGFFKHIGRKYVVPESPVIVAPFVNEDPGGVLLTCDAQHLNAQYYWGGWWICTFDPPNWYYWVFLG